MDVAVPYATKSDGFTTVITGQLLHVDSSTSMDYRTLVECETLEFNCNLQYPPMWNQPQIWYLNFTLCKTTASPVFAHKRFVQDLLDEWSSPSPPDLSSFVPYTLSFSFEFQEFEIILPTNQHNWYGIYVFIVLIGTL